MQPIMGELRQAEENLSEGLRRREAQLRAMEQQIWDKIHRRERVSRNINETHADQMTLGQRMADSLAQLAGSWSFIIGFFSFILLWVAINSVLLFVRPWDPYPFILLNLFLSLLAGIQAPVIMMSQNRQEARDRLRAEQDFEVNLKAELEIEQLHQKMDQLRDNQWHELLEIQNRQMRLLEEQLVLLRNAGPGKADSTATPAVPPGQANETQDR